MCIKIIIFIFTIGWGDLNALLLALKGGEGGVQYDRPSVVT